MILISFGLNVQFVNKFSPVNLSTNSNSSDKGEKKYVTIIITARLSDNQN